MNVEELFNIQTNLTVGLSYGIDYVENKEIE